MKTFRKTVAQIDAGIIRVFGRIHDPLSRIALFAVFFWFGGLKLIGMSPANELVQTLLQKTLPDMPFSHFIIILGSYEMLIGLFFIIPRFERTALILLVPHMVATILPLIVLPDLTWFSFLIPTLEGQYIIKNLALIALAVGIGSRLSGTSSLARP